MIKRVLAVIVALSLFVCTAVVGFAASVTYSYTYPSFSSGSISGYVSPGVWGLFKSFSVPSSSPYTSMSIDVLSLIPDSVSYPVVSVNFDFFYASYSYVLNSTTFNYTPSFSSPVSVPVSVSFLCPDVNSNSALRAALADASFVFNSGESSFDVVSSSVSYSYGVSGRCYYTFSIPYTFISDFFSYSTLSFRFPYSSPVTFTDFSLSFPSSLSPVLVDPYYYRGSVWQNALDDWMAASHGDLSNIVLYSSYYTSLALGEVISNSLRDFRDDIHRTFSPFLLQSTSYLSSMNSYLLSQSQREEDAMKDSVPDGLPGQQDEAQKQLDDYEQKEQQIFDNLDTSLDNLNLDQYQNFDTSIVSSMVFVNRYVTKGFDGLGNFKIILFLPMVIGIGLSVIGRMGAMMSHISVSDRRKGRGP
jgi:hypothetical protein